MTHLDSPTPKVVNGSVILLCHIKVTCSGSIFFFFLHSLTFVHLVYLVPCSGQTSETCFQVGKKKVQLLQPAQICN